MTHIMLDLETWGRTPGCAIRSIGAVVFDPRTGKLGEEFYANIEDRSCPDFGLTRDPETEQWWLDQNIDAQASFATDRRDIDVALADFRMWFIRQHGKFVWGHGASFDPPITEHAMAACGIEVPWNFWDVRCCRTVLALGNRKPQRASGDVRHRALDDAKAQARAVAAVFRSGIFEPN